MKSITYLILVVVLYSLNSCQDQPKTIEPIVRNINKELVLDINNMYKLDQYVSGMPQGKYKGDWQAWFKYRDTISRKHKVRLEEILDTHGYPGFDLVGEVASHNYWNMAQHCDFDVAFQDKVLSALKGEVKKKNAKPSNIGYLTDRINVNLGKPQVYGTQLDYDMSKCRVIPKGGLVDSVNVDKRRAQLNMKPYASYLNELLKSHFKMSKAHYEKIGITEPNYY